MRTDLDLARYPLLAEMQVYEVPASRIAGIGVCLPEHIVDNRTVMDAVSCPAPLKRRASLLIERVTGVRTRLKAEAGVFPSDYAATAGLQVLRQLSLATSDVDTLIFAATDLDALEPATANIVQAKMDIDVINSFDVRNACNSILQALNVANSMIRAGAGRRILITCAELATYWACRDLSSEDELAYKMGGLTLGDAGVALVVEPSDGASGITEINLLTMGKHWHLCHVPDTRDWRAHEGGTIHGWFYLDMPNLARLVRDTTADYLEQYTKYRADNFGEEHFAACLDMFVPHQISRRFLDELAKPEMDVSISADTWGNTASASIPITLDRDMKRRGLTFGCRADVGLYGAASGYSMGHIRMRL
jgi:3-oxoacyl-[acyl-carrier-protein] synthase-3